MDKLVEMGFADRNTNDAMLKKHDGDVSKAIAELVALSDNEWAKKRH